MSARLPWHESQWRIVDDALRQGRGAHALLLTGPTGIGKQQFARQLAQRLLCQAVTESGEACGECRTCQLYAVGAHPDFRMLEPPEDKKTITVDQVRELGRYLTLTPQYGLGKAVVIEPADAMNVNASNSLLKTLEEPVAGVTLILVSHRPAQLPATIRSRCQLIRFNAAAPEQATSWLQAHGVSDGAEASLLLSLSAGAPLRALAIKSDDSIALRDKLWQALEGLAEGKGDAISTAAQLLKLDKVNGIAPLLGWFQSGLLDILKLKAAPQMPFIANEDLISRLHKLALSIPVQRLLSLVDAAQKASASVERNLNPQLILEDVLIQWQNSFVVPRPRQSA